MKSSLFSFFCSQQKYLYQDLTVEKMNERNVERVENTNKGSEQQEAKLKVLPLPSDKQFIVLKSSIARFSRRLISSYTIYSTIQLVVHLTFRLLSRSCFR